MGIDVLSFVEGYFDRIIPVATTYGEFRVSPCPSCGSVKNKLYINVESKVFHCFRCNYGSGMRIERLMRDMGVDPSDYYVDDGDEDFKAYDIRIKEEPEEQEYTLPPEYRPLIGNNSVVGKQALAYVRGRGVNDSLIQEFKIGFCYDGKYKNRIIIPYFEDDKLVYFTARDFTDTLDPKYLNPDWERTHILFNYERATKDVSYTVIVEGPFDILSLPNQSICLLGKQISDKQVIKLKVFKKIYIALDSDAMKDVYDIARFLHVEKGFMNIYIVELPEGEDPGSLGNEKFMHYIHKAKHYDLRSPQSDVDDFMAMIKYLK